MPPAGFPHEFPRKIYDFHSWESFLMDGWEWETLVDHFKKIKGEQVFLNYLAPELYKTSTD